AKTGLQRYDIVLKVNDNEVDSPGKLSYLVASADPGSAVKLTVLRDGKPKVLDIVLDDRDIYASDDSTDTTTQAQVVHPQVPAPLRNNGELLLGVSLTPLTDDLRTASMPADVSGLIVTGVATNSPYFNLFRTGTVIMEVNKKAAASVNDLKSQIKPGQLNMFYIYSPKFDSTVRGQPIHVDAHTDLVTEFVSPPADTKGSANL
ncbi:MAG TPA: PDZ domain-containing protein, partial [Opitutales bacterium]|nr:PDZ domain-containing protein [Opitutales bacterium]